MPDTIAEVLPKQIDRITAKRDRWVKMAAEHPEMATGMNITIALMQHEIMQGVSAAASGDVVGMIAAHEALAAYSDHD